MRSHVSMPPTSALPSGRAALVGTHAGSNQFVALLVWSLALYVLTRGARRRVELKGRLPRAPVCSACARRATVGYPRRICNTDDMS